MQFLTGAGLIQKSLLNKLRKEVKVYMKCQIFCCQIDRKHISKIYLTLFYSYFRNILTQSLPCRGDKIHYDVMMAKTFNSNDVICFLLAVGDFGQSGRHWVNPDLVTSQGSILKSR